MKYFRLWVLFLAMCVIVGMLAAPSHAALTDVKFSRYQVADSQWNVNACLNTSTCQIYSKNPGTMYKIPWYNGQWSWQAGQYVKFALTGNATNPYEGKVYNSNGTQAGTIGTGHIVNMGPDYFFFVGNDNNTGQLFSGTVGMSGSTGVTWTGTRNPTVAQADTLASNYSSEPLASGTTYTAPPAAPALCCGGSSTQFNADAAKSAAVMQFANRTTADSRVSIEQIGNQNTVTVTQSGTRQNFAHVKTEGTNNTVNVTQSGTTSTQVNYTDAVITGDSNTVNITQSSTGGGKGAFVSANNNTNTVTIQQKDSGSHWADVTVSGGNKTVDILQQGSAGHMASVNLTGLATNLSVTQSGSTQQFYSIQHNCATSGGCGTITVQQGN